MGEHQLGLYSAMAYATVAMTLVGDSLGSGVIPRMSRLYADGKLVEFRMLLLKLVAIGCVIGLSGVAIAKEVGPWLLTTVYSSEYAAYSRVFVLLMAAAAIQVAASMLTSGITSARRFRIQVPIFAMVAACSAACCARWVPTMGLDGGAFAAICGAALRLVLAAAVTAHLILTPGCIRPEGRAGQ
jgi:O-antigen/teichoic acid export membrane protein